MGAIHWKRVFLGAVAFVVVYDAVVAVAWFAVLREMWRDTAVRMGFASPESPGFALWFVLLDYATGVLLTWLYAALRPRYGAGPKTAFLVGTMWAVGAGVLPMCALTPLLRLPWMPVIVTGVLGFPAIVGGSLAAGWLYRESQPATTPAMKAAAA